MTTVHAQQYPPPSSNAPPARQPTQTKPGVGVQLPAPPHRSSFKYLVKVRRLIVETNIGQVLSLYQLRATAMLHPPGLLDTKHTPPQPLSFLSHIMNLRHRPWRQRRGISPEVIQVGIAPTTLNSLQWVLCLAARQVHLVVHQVRVTFPDI